MKAHLHNYSSRFLFKWFGNSKQLWPISICWLTRSSNSEKQSLLFVVCYFCKTTYDFATVITPYFKCFWLSQAGQIIPLMKDTATYQREYMALIVSYYINILYAYAFVFLLYWKYLYYTFILHCIIFYWIILGFILCNLIFFLILLISQHSIVSSQPVWIKLLSSKKSPA